MHVLDFVWWLTPTFIKRLSQKMTLFLSTISFTGGSRSMTGKFSRCPHLYRMHDEREASILFCFALFFLWQKEMMVSNFAGLDLRRLMVFTRHVRPPRCHSCRQHLMGWGGVSSASMHPFFLPFHPDTYLGKV